MAAMGDQDAAEVLRGGQWGVDGGPVGRLVAQAQEALSRVLQLGVHPPDEGVLAMVVRAALADPERRPPGRWVTWATGTPSGDHAPWLAAMCYEVDRPRLGLVAVSQHDAREVVDILQAAHGGSPVATIRGYAVRSGAWAGGWHERPMPGDGLASLVVGLPAGQVSVIPTTGGAYVAVVVGLDEAQAWLRARECAAFRDDAG